MLESRVRLARATTAVIGVLFLLFSFMAGALRIAGGSEWLSLAAVVMYAAGTGAGVAVIMLTERVNSMRADAEYRGRNE